MVSSEVLAFILDLLPVPVIVYAMYWAFSIRRALAVPLYRNQMLGVSLVAIGFLWYFLESAFSDLLNDPTYLIPLGVFSFIIPPILTFYWIDASMNTARRSDPLLREIYHWRQVRKGLWGLIIVSFIVLVALFVGSALGVAPSANATPSLPLFIFVLSPIFVAAITGLVFLPRAGRKSGDKRFGNHLRWFGLFIFFVLFHFVLIFFTAGLLNGVLTSLFEIIGGFCLYFSVRWLVPLNKITPIDPEHK